MRTGECFERIGLGEGSRDDRFAWRILLSACLLYALGFACFYPNVVTNDDESGYLRQTRLVLEGVSSVPKVNPLTDQEEDFYPSRYPYGTALTMSVPVALLGWRGAYLIPCTCFLAGVLLLGHWLRQEGRSPLFALLVLGYPPALVMGRVAMSDVPSLFLVILGLWLFFRGIQRGWPWWLGSGFVAGGSILFRESNPIPFAPFFLGALLRRERNVWALIVGGLGGLSLRVLANLYFFAEPLQYRSPYFLALDTLPQRVPVYALALLVFVPGGLLLALLHRGRRWPELSVAVVGFTTAYLIQRYYTGATSLLKNMVVTPRYVIPIIPVIVFGMAESVPRLWGRWLASTSSPRREWLLTRARWIVAIWIAGVSLVGFAVHPLFALWGAGQSEIREAVLTGIDPDAVVLTNLPATRKFLPELELKYWAIDVAGVDADTTNSMIQRYRNLFIVFLDRSDSEYWIGDAQRNAQFLREIRPEPELTLDRQITSTDRLRIWRVRLDGDRPG
jgi:hypothetical protein